MRSRLRAPLLLLLNGGGRSRTFALPPGAGPHWEPLLTSVPFPPPFAAALATLVPHSFMLLRPAGPAHPGVSSHE